MESALTEEVHGEFAHIVKYLYRDDHKLLLCFVNDSIMRTFNNMCQMCIHKLCVLTYGRLTCELIKKVEASNEASV